MEHQFSDSKPTESAENRKVRELKALELSDEQIAILEAAAEFEVLGEEQSRDTEVVEIEVVEGGAANILDGNYGIVLSLYYQLTKQLVTRSFRSLDWLESHGRIPSQEYLDAQLDLHILEYIRNLKESYRMLINHPNSMPRTISTRLGDWRELYGDRFTARTFSEVPLGHSTQQEHVNYYTTVTATVLAAFKELMEAEGAYWTAEAHEEDHNSHALAFIITTAFMASIVAAVAVSMF